MGTDHTCPLHLAGDRLCYKGCGCRCEDCTEMHRWDQRGAPQAPPGAYKRDLSAGNCVGFRQFTELPMAAQYRACITCPVFAICPQPTPWPRGECCREGHDVEHRHPTLKHCTECERERGRRKKLIARSRASERAPEGHRQRPPLPVGGIVSIGDLTARHLGQRIRIPGLHDPRSDWDAPEITVEGVLTLMGEPGIGRGTVLIRLRKATGTFHEVLTLDHPCEVIE